MEKKQANKKKPILRNLVLAVVAVVLLAFGFSENEIKNLLGFGNSTQVDVIGEEAIVKRVIDGDTVIVTTKDGTEERVRLLLIDTPESVHPNGEIEKFGPEASDYAKSYLSQGQKIILERGNPDRDKYERLLGYIWVDGVNFNQHMIEEGYARVGYVFEPNTKYIDEFREAEERAKSKGKNIWSIEGYVTDRGFDMSVVK